METSRKEPPPDKVQQYYLQKIINLTGIQPDNLNITDLRSLYIRAQMFMDDVLPPQFGSKLASFEEKHRLWHAIEGYLDLSPFFQSYGVCMPSYVLALKNYKAIHSSFDNHTSLLVGALTPETIQEYVTAVSYVFPHSLKHVVDNVDRSSKELTADIAQFSCIDARSASQMSSLGNETMDTVHTNNLMDQIGPIAQRSESYARSVVLSNCLQLLKPGGKMIMVERNGDEDYMKGMIQKEAQNAGFQNVEAKPAISFQKRRSVEQCLANGIADIDSYAVYESESLSLIVATK